MENCFQVGSAHQSNKIAAEESKMLERKRKAENDAIVLVFWLAMHTPTHIRKPLDFNKLEETNDGTQCAVPIKFNRSENILIFCFSLSF